MEKHKANNTQFYEKFRNLDWFAFVWTIYFFSLSISRNRASYRTYTHHHVFYFLHFSPGFLLFFLALSSVSFNKGRLIDLTVFLCVNN